MAHEEWQHRSHEKIISALNIQQHKPRVKQIPNFFTLLNLLFGCIAVVYVIQPGLVPLYTGNDVLLNPDLNNEGTQFISIPEQMFMASLFIGLAAAVDFLDGFVARWLHAT